MSCNYADGLSPYEHKGILGAPEKFDSIEKFNKKCEILAKLIEESKHVVVHTGAGISTSAGIPDFRGPNGVWTLERDGKKPTIDTSFADAKPTKTHMILKKLIECQKIHYIVSQNIDGLHMKSGLSRNYLAELHGNMFIDECSLCKSQFIRASPSETVGKKSSNRSCPGRARACRGRLCDVVLDWEHSLPDHDLTLAECHSGLADLSLCLGTTLQIIPSGNLPLETLKYGGKLVICNLQPTKHDNKADLIINYYVDDVLEKVMEILGIDIPAYDEADNPVLKAKTTVIDWTICKNSVKEIEKMYKKKYKGVKKKRVLVKSKRESFNSENELDNKKMIKLEIKNETNCGSNGVVGAEDTKHLNYPQEQSNDKEISTNNTSSIDTKVIKTETGVVIEKGNGAMEVKNNVNMVISTNELSTSKSAHIPEDITRNSDDEIEDNIKEHIIVEDITSNNEQITNKQIESHEISNTLCNEKSDNGSHSGNNGRISKE